MSTADSRTFTPASSPAIVAPFSSAAARQSDQEGAGALQRLVVAPDTEGGGPPFGGAGLLEAAELLADPVLVADHRQVARAFGALPVHHRAVGRDVAIDGEDVAGRGAGRRDVARDGDRQAGHDPGRWAAGAGG